MRYSVDVKERCTIFWEVEVEAQNEGDARVKALEDFAAGRKISGEVDEVGVFGVERVE